MPELNRVPFVYEPINGDLYLDHFRSMFHMERLDDIKDELQNITVHEGVIVQPIEGEITFRDTEDSPPTIRSVRYHSVNDRQDADNDPNDHFPVTLPAE